MIIAGGILSSLENYVKWRRRKRVEHVTHDTKKGAGKYRLNMAMKRMPRLICCCYVIA